MHFDIQYPAVLQRPRYPSSQIRQDERWITCYGKDMLWIPLDYLDHLYGICHDVCGNMIGIGTKEGRVWICHVDPETVSELYL